MPLLPGKANIGTNIKELNNGKRPLKQRIAIALSTARKSGAEIPSPKSGFGKRYGVEEPEMEHGGAAGTRGGIGTKFKRYGA